MQTFFVIYSLVAVSVIISIFFLSANEHKKPIYKTIITIIYILSLIGTFFSMGIIEGKYGISQLISSCIAAVVIGLMYLSDNLGAKMREKDENK